MKKLGSTEAKLKKSVAYKKNVYKKLSGYIIESAPYSETVMLYMPFFLYVTPTVLSFYNKP